MPLKVPPETFAALADFSEEEKAKLNKDSTELIERIAPAITDYSRAVGIIATHNLFNDLVNATQQEAIRLEEEGGNHLN